MQDLSAALKDLNLDFHKLQELATAAQSNPFAALSKLQELGITMDSLQKLMGLVKANPEGFMNMAREAGVPEEALAAVKDKLKRFT